VFLSSPEVPNPTVARYGWANNPAGCNLYNKAGLPAAPFRTQPPKAN
jgi:sialate O-acetylesterase